jgi:multicomponent Na+:H+ antiporter subunit D
MGLGLFTTLALAGSVFYIIHHIIVKTNLFLISGVVERISGSYDLKKLGGIYGVSPLLSALFLIPAFSLAGLPPFSGFFAKLFLLRAGLDVSNYAIVAVALAVGFLTLFSMMKIWNEVFWKPSESGDAAKPKGAEIWVPVMALAALTVAIGLAVEPVYRISEEAARQLANPADYIQAVLGDRMQ